MELPADPGMLDWLSEQLRAGPEVELERLTLPVKPLIPLTVTTDVARDPAVTPTVVGAATSVKSGDWLATNR